MKYLQSTAWALLVGGAMLLPHGVGNAALFEDGEARRAILEIRSRIDEITATQLRDTEDKSQLRRSLLDLQTQIEKLQQEVSVLRGQNEQLMRSASDLQQRLRQFEPSKVLVDGDEFVAAPEEQRVYEDAFAAFRSGDFPVAQNGFKELLQKYPRTGYRPSALFWLGNAQYANRNYKEAMENLRALTATEPGHMRAPEAALAIANCQVELKDISAARRTLEDLIKAYPDAEAAVTAKERLARLR